MGLKVDGVSFDLSRYPYLVELFDRRPLRKTVIKGAQMAFTTTFVLDAIMSAWTESLRGIGYFFPNDSDVRDFSQARFGPMVTDNAAFAGLVDSTDSAQLKRVANTHIYFRPAGAIGASTKHSLSRVKSIPLDIIYLDEADEMQPARVDAIQHRLDGSSCPREVRLSTPTIPGLGVDLDYEASSKATYHWKCMLCNGWTCLEKEWPVCLIDPSDGSTPYYQCSKCHKPLILREYPSEWVHEYPSRKDHLGYRVSQLCSPTRSPAAILAVCRESTESGRPREFYNQTLAMAHAEIEDQLTPEKIDDCLTDEPRRRSAKGPTAFGVDPGVKVLHYWIKQRISSRDSRTLSYGSVSGFEDLKRLWKDFNGGVGVMDVGAETREVWRFVKNTPGWWACRYSPGKTGPYDWDLKKKLVMVNRTEALDASHLKFVEGREKLPAANETYHDQVVPQLCNMARVKQENSQTGAVKYVWVVVGGKKNDHLKHAHAYATIAEEKVSLADEAEPRRTKGRRWGRKRGWMAA
jgi:hypothetical protein